MQDLHVRTITFERSGYLIRRAMSKKNIDRPRRLRALDGLASGLLFKYKQSRYDEDIQPRFA
jgi:hypothetical protein